MGGGGVPSGGVTIVNGRHGDLPKSGKPNSRADLYLNGKKVQSRWFDHEGKVIRNRDYDHQDAHNNHEFPHDHNWIWINGIPKRGKEGLHPDRINYF